MLQLGQSSNMVSADEHIANTSVTCNNCVGFQCCCQASCGIVEGSNVNYMFDFLPGESFTTNSIKAKDAYSNSIVTNEHAQSQCLSSIAQYFSNTWSFSSSKPCCLYTGNTGFQ